MLATPIFALALSAGSTTVNLVPAFSVTTKAPPSDGYFLIRRPRLPTELDTLTLNFSGAGGVDGSGAGVSTTGGGLAGVVGAGVGAGVSLLALWVGAVSTGIVSAGTFSKYHAAQKPSLPSGVRTRTHWLIPPTFDKPSVSSNNNFVPATTVSTTLAMLDVSMLDRMLSPHVTSSRTRA